MVGCVDALIGFHLGELNMALLGSPGRTMDGPLILSETTNLGFYL